jgi:hypothetical protein
MFTNFHGFVDDRMETMMDLGIDPKPSNDPAGASSEDQLRELHQTLNEAGVPEDCMF